MEIQIRNTVNGKIYVGSSVDMQNRWRQHLQELLRGTHKSKHLQSAWTKYGLSGFAFEILETVGKINDLIAREQFYLDKLCVTDRKCGYNNVSKAGSVLGLKHSEEARKKNGDAKRGIKRGTPSAETRSKISATQKGRSLSANHLKSIREAAASRKGVKWSAEACAKLPRKKGIPQPWNRGRKWSSESRARQSAAKIGHPTSAETRKKIGDWHRGKSCKPTSDSTRLKLSAATSLVWERRRGGELPMPKQMRPPA